MSKGSRQAGTLPNQIDDKQARDVADERQVVLLRICPKDRV